MKGIIFTFIAVPIVFVLYLFGMWFIKEFIKKEK